jgi:hypothetical protein
MNGWMDGWMDGVLLKVPERERGNRAKDAKNGLSWSSLVLEFLVDHT